MRVGEGGWVREGVSAWPHHGPERNSRCGPVAGRERELWPSETSRHPWRGLQEIARPKEDTHSPLERHSGCRATPSSPPPPPYHPTARAPRSLHPPPLILLPPTHTPPPHRNAWTISWLFNGRVVRVTENVYHQQDLVLKLDSETMPTWFGLPSGNWRNQTYSVLYLRAWSRTARHVRNDGDGDGTTCHVRTITESRVAPARGHARISKYALQRAPSPGSKQVAGLAEPVPVKGWGAFLGRGPIGRGERFFPPTRVGAA